MPGRSRGASGHFHRSAELQFGILRRAPNGPIWKSALQARCSCSQFMRPVRFQGSGTSVPRVPAGASSRTPCADARSITPRLASSRSVWSTPGLPALSGASGLPTRAEAEGGAILQGCGQREQAPACVQRWPEGDAKRAAGILPADRRVPHRPILPARCRQHANQIRGACSHCRRPTLEPESASFFLAPFLLLYG